MRVQKINYYTNNYSVKLNQNQKQNPAFGKLIVGEKYIPTDILQAVIKNEELKKLAKMFQERGKDLELSYSYDRSLMPNQLNGLYFHVKDDTGRSDEIIASFHQYIDDLNPISAKINELKEGFAVRVYNEYVKQIEKAKDIGKKMM